MVDIESNDLKPNKILASPELRVRNNSSFNSSSPKLQKKGEIELLDLSDEVSTSDEDSQENNKKIENIDDSSTKTIDVDENSITQSIPSVKEIDNTNNKNEPINIDVVDTNKDLTSNLENPNKNLESLSVSSSVKEDQNNPSPLLNDPNLISEPTKNENVTTLQNVDLKDTNGNSNVNNQDNNSSLNNTNEEIKNNTKKEKQPPKENPQKKNKKKTTKKTKKKNIKE